MDTLLNLRTAIQSDFTVGSDSSLYSPTTIDLAINRAYIKVQAVFPWPELEDAKKTVTTAGQNYYDYPQTWRSDSIWKVVVNSERYGEDPDGSPLSFDDFLNWKTDYPDSTDKKWSNQERRFFISPTPTVSDLEICVWGNKVVGSLSENTDTTVFSYSMPEVNEAIVLEAGAILKSKVEQEKSGEFRSIEAKQILIVAWAKLTREKAKYEKNQPFFNVTDMFGNGTTQDLRGRF